ncbi:MAG: hypothetical protein EBQ78_00345 [Betaproteobacteria bacterium]|nr:hypothetical protein [Betaproteobacteria bacterium]
MAILLASIQFQCIGLALHFSADVSVPTWLASENIQTLEKVLLTLSERVIQLTLVAASLQLCNLSAKRAIFGLIAT